MVAGAGQPGLQQELAELLRPGLRSDHPAPGPARPSEEFGGFFHPPRRPSVRERHTAGAVEGAPGKPAQTKRDIRLLDHPATRHASVVGLNGDQAGLDGVTERSPRHVWLEHLHRLVDNILIRQCLSASASWAPVTWLTPTPSAWPG